MKEFMEKLYSNQYFGVVLFAVIGILALLFIIVLILALRDAKKRKQIEDVTLESDKEEEMANVAFAKVNDNPVNLEVKEDIPQEEPKKEEDIVEIKPTESDGFDSVVVEAPTTMPVEDNKSLFPDLEIDKPVADEAVSIEPSIEEPVKEELKQEVVEQPKEEVSEEPVLKPQQPEQFSSIYVTPGAIPKKEEEKVSTPTDLPNFADIPAPTPVRVVNETSIIDSSAKVSPEVNANNVSKTSEEYTLK